MGKDVTYINPKSAPKPGLYGHVAIANGGRIAYIAGQTSVDMAGNPLAAGDIAGQVPVVFGHIGNILKELGADFSDVLQYTTYIVERAGADPRPAFRAARAELYKKIYPDGKYPPNTLLVISGLAAHEYMLEISVIARVP